MSAGLQDQTTVDVTGPTGRLDRALLAVPGDRTRVVGWHRGPYDLDDAGSATHHMQRDRP